MTKIEANTPAAPEQRGQRTRPWSPAEFIRVDGRALVYSVNKITKDVIIALPGGRLASPAALRRAGRAVVMPAQLRLDSFD